jgi:hypothetical protein
MKYISTVILFLGFSSFAFTQETFSKIIGFDETIADLGVHLRLLDDQILVYSLHGCLTPISTYEACTSISVLNYEGTVEEVMFIDDFKPYRGNTSILQTDTLFLIGNDKTVSRHNISLLKYYTNTNTTETLNIGKDSSKIFVSEGILEFNNSNYIYGHYDDLNTGVRIKGFIKKWSKDFKEELDSFSFGDNETLNIRSMHTTVDSHFVFTLNTAKVGPGGGDALTLVKIDTLGEIIDEKIIEGSQFNHSDRGSLVKDAKDNFYFTHHRYSDSKISKISSNLDSMLWTTILPSDNHPYERDYEVSKLLLARNGDIVVAGIVSYIHENIGLVHSSFLARMNPEGEIIWIKILSNETSFYAVADMHFRQSYLKDILELPNGNIVGVGEVFEELQNGSPRQEFWLIMISGEGCVENFDCEDDIYVLNTGESFPILSGTSDLLELDDLVLYPNPANELLTVKLNHEFTYHIQNTQGQIILTGESKGEINLKDLPSGIYFIQIQQEDKLFKAIKFVKL